MATDLAEFLGGAIGLALLFHLPLLAGMVVTAIVTYGLLMCETYGFRPLELIIGSMVGVICVSYLIEMLIAPVDWAAAAYHTVTPQLAGAEALLLAVGIIGATVMPHAIYLHSGLTQSRVPVRDDNDRRMVQPVLQPGSRHRARRRRPGQHGDGHDGVGRVSRRSSGSGGNRDRLSHAHPAARRRGSRGPPRFAHRLGRVVLDGRHDGRPDDHARLHRLRIPIWVRRLVTMVPAFVVVGVGANATNALVISQVVLSIALPLPMISLLMFTRRADIMGQFANGRLTQLAAIGATTIVLLLNIFLILQTFGVPIPGLSGRRLSRYPGKADRAIPRIARRAIRARGFVRSLRRGRPYGRTAARYDSVFNFSGRLAGLRSTTTSKETRWPSLSSRRPARSTVLIWTKTSSPPPSG